MAQQAKVFGLMAVLTAFLVLIGGLLGGRTGIMLALGFSVITNVGAYWFSDRMVLRMYKAQIIGPDDAPNLYQMVDRLRQRAGLPMPTVAICAQQQPNAFATGRSPEKAVVCFTQGLLDAMGPDEIAAIAAHELGHIKHRHMLVGTIAATVAGAISALAYWGVFLSGRENRNIFVQLGVMLLAPIAAAIIQMAISRQNEFQADRTAADIMGGPDGLVSALQGLESYARRIPMNVNAAAAQLAIINPFGGVKQDGLRRLISTHPPTADRIAALRAWTPSA